METEPAEDSAHIQHGASIVFRVSKGQWCDPLEQINELLSVARNAITHPDTQDHMQLTSTFSTAGLYKKSYLRQQDPHLILTMF